jgi:hypothetical protein
MQDAQQIARDKMEAMQRMVEPFTTLTHADHAIAIWKANYDSE